MCLCVCLCVCVHACVHVCVHVCGAYVCVCVCEREREKEKLCMCYYVFSAMYCTFREELAVSHACVVVCCYKSRVADVAGGRKSEV